MESCDILGRVSKAIGLRGALPDIAGLVRRIPPTTGFAIVLAMGRATGLDAKQQRRPPHPQASLVVVWRHVFQPAALAFQGRPVVGARPSRL